MSMRAFEIDASEYEKRRDVFRMHRWARQTLLRLEKHPNFESIYFERRGIVKKLLEEFIPISRLGLWLMRPGDTLYATCLTGNQPYDAVFEYTRWGSKNTEQIKIEATTTETQD